MRFARSGLHAAGPPQALADQALGRGGARGGVPFDDKTLGALSAEETSSPPAHSRPGGGGTGHGACAPDSMSLPIYLISAGALLGVVVRPWRTPEVLWAVAGGAALVGLGFVPWREALGAIGQGGDVYGFLTGMMLLSTLAQREGFFETLAAFCVARAHGSPRRLFLLVYALGVLVTVFMSNDATAVVLTPAVLAVCKKSGGKPLPYLLACALVANAASFVLPVSNPANLVVFADRLPPLAQWIARFGLASVASIAVTYGVLRWKSREDLREPVRRDVRVPPLSGPGKTAALGVALMAAVLLACSAADASLGLPALLAATLVGLAISIQKRESPLPLLKEISWSILPLVAGLFVIVEGLRLAGLLQALTEALHAAAERAPSAAAMGSGALVALACNLMNNLPAGLVADATVAGAKVGTLIQSPVLIGIDLGPNLSITGSLATILWLVALRAEGEHVSAWTFLKIGALAMPLALIAALVVIWGQAAAGR